MSRYYDEYDEYDDQDDGFNPNVFASEGSALRAAGPNNPRNLPCPRCERENMLTPDDKARGYVCDACADAAERGYDY